MSANAQAVITGLDAGAEGAGDDTQQQAADTSGVDDAAGAGVAEGDAAAAAGAGTALKQEMVPQGALHEARQQVKALKAQIAALETQPKLTTEDAALLKELRETRTAAQNQEPDFLADPKGYVDAKVAAAAKASEEAKKVSDVAKQAADEQAHRQDIWQQTAAAESAFVQQAPDYAHALEHVRSVQARQLALLHPEATPEQIKQHIAFTEVQAAAGCLAQGRNPAQFAYEMAQALGYRPQAKPGGKQTPGKMIDKDAARSLGSGGGDSDGADADEGDGMPEFKAALSERFKRK